MISSTGILFAAALVAFSLSAISGGGAGLLLIPLLGGFLPTAQVPAALSLGTAVSSVSRLVTFFRAIRWDVVRWFVPAAVPAVAAGAWLLGYVNPQYLELLMGLFLVSNLPQLFRKPNSETSGAPLPAWGLSLIGLGAGFVSGLTGAVGVLFNRFYLRYGMEKEEIVATRAANELLLHLVKVGLYAHLGLLTGNALRLGGAVALAALGASWGMQWVLPRVRDTWFRRIGYAAMVVSGVFMLQASGRQLAQEAHLHLAVRAVEGGLETRVQWQATQWTLELEKQEGLALERTVARATLPPEVQQNVRAHQGMAPPHLIEEVFGWHTHHYEVHFRQPDGSERILDVA
ncbi:hypothetical protein SAMN05421823_11449 [Catalinimonas alkaloidigena]|uniref:Probable membrane transporter protein n=1 Tax=Catalinimonas alkaloidigena TaxID=1075417 RepID=A0A1G9TKR3_9BACT|nr:sulfite exporter TauE/SafE family protein [Catalinimonas alkaloidigena]SDM48307.1 hypothetical protein SAMN05421823_11449 [Catalinimonas alkaloidigena]